MPAFIRALAVDIARALAVLKERRGGKLTSRNPQSKITQRVKTAKSTKNTKFLKPKVN